MDFGMDFAIAQYADDILIIMHARCQQVLVMKDILEIYVISTGLKINFHKSSLIPINLSEASAHTIADILGCSIASMPFTYLGFL
jgi:hypothetical protein